jgi:hypothetical protein
MNVLMMASHHEQDRSCYGPCICLAKMQDRGAFMSINSSLQQIAEV